MSKTKIAMRDLQFKAVGCYAYAADVLGKRRDKLPPLEDRSGEVAVVTGGARGLGLHVVEFLLRCNYTVVVGVRSPEKAEKVLNLLKNSSNAVILPLDLDCLQSVERFSEALLAKFDKVNVLVNNAGILLAPYAMTRDGVERNFGVNYLGHFYLTHLLAPALVKAGSEGRTSRVIAVTSTTYLGGKIHFEDINLDCFRCRSEAYAQSKLALVMNSSYLADIAKQRGWHVSFFTVDPGIVNTEAFDNTPIKKYLIGADKILKSPAEGTKSILYACLNRDLDSKNGEFITNCGSGIRSSFSKNKEHQKKLFLLSCDMLKVRPETFGEKASEVSITHL